MDRDRPMYTIVETILRPIFMFVYRVRITGREHVPETGPCVLAANHVSVMDGFFLGIAVTRQVRFMAKAELHRVPIVKQILEGAGAFPVERGADAGRAVAAAVEAARAGRRRRGLSGGDVAAGQEARLQARRGAGSLSRPARPSSPWPSSARI